MIDLRNQQTPSVHQTNQNTRRFRLRAFDAFLLRAHRRRRGRRCVLFSLLVS
jgi:hypothetical protein